MIMDKKILIPVRMMDSKNKIMCVYKLFFGKKFYIGSSCDLRHRIGQHIRNIKTNKSSKNLIEAYQSCSCIDVEVVFETNDNGLLRKKEYEYIFNFLDDSNCLNKSLCTKAVLGIPFNKSRVNQYNEDGTIICFESFAAAARSIGINPGTFGYRIKLGHRVRGLTFRVLDDLGNPVIPMKKEHKKTIQWKDKRILKYDKKGRYIQTFDTIDLAITSINGNYGCFTLHLKNGTGSYKGFAWKAE